MAPHNVINTKSDYSALCTQGSGLSLPLRWERGEDGVTRAHGCLGPQELWAISKALQDLGLKCFQPTAGKGIWP